MANLTMLRGQSQGQSQTLGLGRNLAAALAGEWTPPPLVAADPAGRQRSKIWDIGATLHCSIIGTCLTAAELRRFFVKLDGEEARTATDHALHGRGVQTAGQRTAAGKLLHKALDKRHEAAVRRFAKAASPAAVRELWRQSLEDGDIPGAYWAVLTHPATDRALVQEAFGEIHMLSHMVGSSSRLDLARLRRAEQMLGERDDTIVRQQARLQAAARERSDLLRRLETLDSLIARQAASERAASERATPAVPVELAALQRKLEDEKARTARLATHLAEAEDALSASREAIAALAQREAALLAELSAFERELGGEAAVAGAEGEAGLDGRILLYVGGRPGQVEKLKAITGRRGGTLLTHDGGIEDNAALLPGLLSQAEAAFFPVDCVSHRAAGRIKKLCREAGKPFVPLRTASLASFLAAFRGAGPLHRPEAALSVEA